MEKKQKEKIIDQAIKKLNIAQGIVFEAMKKIDQWTWKDLLPTNKK